MKLSTIFTKVLATVVSVLFSFALLFFIAIAVISLITKQDFVVVMNAAFDWFKNLVASK